MVKFRNKLRKSLVLKEIIETCDINHRTCDSNMREKMSEERFGYIQGAFREKDVYFSILNGFGKKRQGSLLFNTLILS